MDGPNGAPDQPIRPPTASFTADAQQAGAEDRQPVIPANEEPDEVGTLEQLKPLINAANSQIFDIEDLHSNPELHQQILVNFLDALDEDTSIERGLEQLMEEVLPEVEQLRQGRKKVGKDLPVVVEVLSTAEKERLHRPGLIRNIVDFCLDEHNLQLIKLQRQRIIDVVSEEADSPQYKLKPRTQELLDKTLSQNLDATERAKRILLIAWREDLATLANKPGRNEHSTAEKEAS